MEHDHVRGILKFDERDIALSPDLPLELPQAEATVALEAIHASMTATQLKLSEVRMSPVLAIKSTAYDIHAELACLQKTAMQLTSVIDGQKLASEFDAFFKQ